MNRPKTEVPIYEHQLEPRVSKMGYPGAQRGGKSAKEFGKNIQKELSYNI